MFSSAPPNQPGAERILVTIPFPVSSHFPMPRTRQRAKGQTLESFERELEAVRAEEEAHAQALAEATQNRERARQRREELEALKRQVEEEEAFFREQERRLHMSRRSESLERGAFADLAWEKMGDDGECGECRKLGVECYRAPVDPNARHPANVQRVLIGKQFYSRCQECKAHRRKCAIEREGPVEIKIEALHTRQAELQSPTVKPTPAPSVSPSKRKREGSTHTPEINTPPQKEKTTSVGQLPTPSSSVAEFVQGSSSKPLGKESRTRKSGSKRKRLKKLEGEVAGLHEQVAGLHEKVADMNETQRQVLLIVTRLAGSGISAGSQGTKDYESEELEYTDGE